MTRGISLLLLQKWPKDDGWNAVQSHEKHEHQRCDDSLRDGLKKRQRQDHHCLDRGRKLSQMSDWRDKRRSKPPLGRTKNFTLLNTSLDQVLMQIRDDVALTWSNKLQGNPSKRTQNKYYHFHRDHGHDTSECYDPKQQIEALIKQGKLQQFVRGDENLSRDLEPNQWAEEIPKAPFSEIRVIMGGNIMAGSSKKAKKTYLCTVQNVQISGWPPKATRVDNPTINFTEEDARQLHHPHDYPLVISLSIVDFNSRQVLVDNPISADIL